MTFSWVTKQHVRSDAGFEVLTHGRFEMQYREGVQVVTIPVEDGFFGGGPSISISGNAFEFWDNHRTRNSREKQDAMRQNFKAALAFQGLKLEE